MGIGGEGTGEEVAEGGAQQAGQVDQQTGQAGQRCEHGCQESWPRHPRRRSLKVKATRSMYNVPLTHVKPYKQAYLCIICLFEKHSVTTLQ